MPNRQRQSYTRLFLGSLFLIGLTICLWLGQGQEPGRGLQNTGYGAQRDKGIGSTQAQGELNTQDLKLKSLNPQPSVLSSQSLGNAAQQVQQGVERYRAEIIKARSRFGNLHWLAIKLQRIFQMRRSCWKTWHGLTANWGSMNSRSLSGRG